MGWPYGGKWEGPKFLKCISRIYNSRFLMILWLWGRFTIPCPYFPLRVVSQEQILIYSFYKYIWIVRSSLAKCPHNICRVCDALCSNFWRLQQWKAKLFLHHGAHAATTTTVLNEIVYLRGNIPLLPLPSRPQWWAELGFCQFLRASRPAWAKVYLTIWQGSSRRLPSSSLAEVQQDVLRSDILPPVCPGEE